MSRSVSGLEASAVCGASAVVLFACSSKNSECVVVPSWSSEKKSDAFCDCESDQQMSHNIVDDYSLRSFPKGMKGLYTGSIEGLLWLKSLYLHL